MKVFLTGGTGYLGRALVGALLEAEHQVTIFARRPPEGSEDPRVRWIQGDLLTGPPPADELHRHRAVIHAAAMVKSWARNRTEFDRVNVEAWEALLALCHRVGVQKVIHTSSFISLGPSASPEPRRESDRGERTRFLTEYERTKFLADQVTDRWIAKGTPVVTLYPGVIYGAGSPTDGNLVGKMIWMIARGRFPGLVGSGAQVWNIAYLPDVAAGHVLALERALAGRSYFLGGENIRLDDLLRRIYRLLGKRGAPARIPVGLAEAMGSVFERLARFTGRAPDLTRGVASVYRYHWSFDSSAAQRDLGYRITPVDQALEETVRWAGSLREWKE